MGERGQTRTQTSRSDISVAAARSKDARGLFCSRDRHDVQWRQHLGTHLHRASRRIFLHDAVEPSVLNFAWAAVQYGGEQVVKPPECYTYKVRKEE